MAPLPKPPPSPNVRRSSRASLPNTVLMYRRQMIRENFCKTAVQTTKKQLNAKLSAIKSKLSAKVQNKSKSNSSSNQKKPHTDRESKQPRQLNRNRNGSVCSGSDDMADAQTKPPPTLDAEFADIKTEKSDNTTDETAIPKSFGKCLKMLSISLKTYFNSLCVCVSICISNFGFSCDQRCCHFVTNGRWHPPYILSIRRG